MHPTPTEAELPDPDEEPTEYADEPEGNGIDSKVVAGEADDFGEDDNDD